MLRQNIKQRKAKWHYDKWILFSTLTLILFGLLMVASASMVISDKEYGYPFHYFFRQGINLMLGIFLAWIVTRIEIKYWQQWSIPLIIFSLLLLFVVLVPGIGRVVNGSRRWLHLGVLTLQVSEVVKLCAVVYLASYLQRFQKQVQEEFIGFMKPLMILGIIVLLLLMEPDFGTATVITMTFLILLFTAGVRWKPFTALFLTVVFAMTLIALTSPYRLERLTTFIDPWRTAYGSGYQLTQSLIAFGRGGLMGVGLGNSIQKLFYLPEAHTDFIFAVIGEELGLLGELLLITLFLVLIIRIIILGKKNFDLGNLFHAYLCYGMGFWFGLQAMINMGVNIGLLPTKGLTLPFISYGGSSLLINCIVIGILLRVSYETHFGTHSLSDGKLKAKYHKY